MGRFSGFLHQDRVGLLQEAGVEAFGKRVIDRAQQCAFVGVLVAQPGETKHGAQLLATCILLFCQFLRVVVGALGEVFASLSLREFAFGEVEFNGVVEFAGGDKRVIQF